MVSSLALRAQIASVVDALSRAAAAEIAKVVEDGVAVLRLEMCRRDNEIQTLRGNVEALHAELRAERDRLTLRPDSRGRDGSQSGSGGEGTLPDNVPEVQVKAAPLEPGQEEAGGRPHQPGGEPAHHEGSGGRWGPAAQNEAVRPDADYMRLGQSSLPCLPGSPIDGLGRGLLGHGQHRNLCHVARRRTAKRLLFKKGFVCPYCGKVFEHAGHLERHKRIHTGEKPYRCEICGRRFNQKCSMKEHTKIHRRCFQPRLAEVQVQVQVQGGEQKPTPEAKPCADGQWPEEGGQTYGEDGVPKNEDAPPTALVQVKSEPTEESVTQPGPLHGENGRTGEGAHGLGENFPAFGRDGQQWVSRPQGQSGVETSGRELLGGSAQSTTSLAGIAALLPAPVEASCSAFSFPGKLYSELKSSSQAPYGPPDTLLMPGETGVCGLAEAPPNHHRQQRGRSLQAIRPKKCFVCSYCGKVFERAGHLERHLRIHTGEKPYGCHVCGRCFNQKSSLKGHMKTHRNGEDADVLEPHHLMFTMPDNQPLESQVGPAAFEEPLPGSEAVGEQVAAVVVVKLEPNGEGFQPGPDNDTGATDWSHLWTPGTEKGGGGGSVGSAGQTVCSLPGDVMYRISPAAGAAYERQGYMAPVKDPPFPDDNEMEDTMPDEQYAMMGPQSGSPGVTLALGPRDGRMVPEAALRDYGAAGDGTAFDFNMSASSDREENCGGDAAGPSSFICSSCGQSLNSFSLFQQHKCKTMTDQT